MSSKENRNFALGMIETRGLIGAIEAADAACKAAKVMLIGKEKVKGGLINIKIVGEVAAVRSAIDAGAAAAQKVGELLGTHVIPNPADELDILIYPEPGKRFKEPDSANNTGKITHQPVIKEDIESDSKTELFDSEEEVEQVSLDYSSFEGDDNELLSKLEEMTVHELRRMARGFEGLSIAGREISKANKEKLIYEIMESHRKK